ncbi:hypothetical protein [Aeromonas hydrophila]
MNTIKVVGIDIAKSIFQVLHIRADHEHRFWFNVNTISGPA